jgi:hypothetical protein
MYRVVLFLLAALLAVFLVGCATPALSSPDDATAAPGAAETPANTPATDESPLATPDAGAAGELSGELAAAATTWLAGQANVGAADLSVVEAERVEWTDSCFGLGGPAESCLQAMTPGWRIVFEAGGQQYEVRTDEAGTSFRLAPQAS